MKEKFKNILEQLKTFWKGLTKALKIAIIAVAAGIIILAIVITVVLNSSSDDEYIVYDIRGNFTGLCRASERGC